MAEKFTPEQREKLKEVFEMNDENKNGFVDVAGLERALQALGKTGKSKDKLQKMMLAAIITDMREIFAELDVNKDNRLSMQELSEALEVTGKTYTHEELQKALADWDMDCDGTIEFHEYMAKIEAHKREYNSITFNEFLTLMYALQTDS